MIVHREAVESYKPGDMVEVDFDRGSLIVGGKKFSFEPLPDELKGIIEKKGLVNWMKNA